MNIEIGVYDARTRLPELLREVKAGKRFTITYRGEAVADLVPSEAASRGDPGAAIDRFREFLRRNPVSLHKTSIKALLEVERT